MHTLMITCCLEWTLYFNVSLPMAAQRLPKAEQTLYTTSQSWGASFWK